jgi:hypothetical protein
MPEICAQRDAEGRGFLFVVAEAGPAAALAEAGVELCNVYISLRDERQLTRSHHHHHPAMNAFIANEARGPGHGVIPPGGTKPQTVEM